MTDKSHVSMEQHQCIVCGQLYDTGAILLDKRLKASMERHTVTGQGLCPEHQKLHDDGYVALVAVKNAPANKSKLKQEEAERTGEIVHLRRTVAAEIFKQPPPDDLPMVFCDPEIIEMLKKMAPDA